MKKILGILLLALVAVSCGPSNKEEYLADFENFVINVGENYEKYSIDDWEEAKEKYDRFAGEWYDEFKPEMSNSEKLKVISLKLKFREPYRKFNRGRR